MLPLSCIGSPKKTNNNRFLLVNGAEKLVQWLKSIIVAEVLCRLDFFPIFVSGDFEILPY